MKEWLNFDETHRERSLCDSDEPYCIWMNVLMHLWWIKDYNRPRIWESDGKPYRRSKKSLYRLWPEPSKRQKKFFSTIRQWGSSHWTWSKSFLRECKSATNEETKRNFRKGFQGLIFLNWNQNPIRGGGMKGRNTSNNYEREFRILKNSWKARRNPMLLSSVTVPF